MAVRFCVLLFDLSDLVPAACPSQIFGIAIEFRAICLGKCGCKVTGGSCRHQRGGDFNFRDSDSVLETDRSTGRNLWCFWFWRRRWNRDGWFVLDWRGKDPPPPTQTV